MKVCVLYAPKGSESLRVRDVADRFAQGIRSAGNLAQVYNVNTNANARIIKPALFDHTVVIAEPTGILGGRIPASVAAFLGSCASVTGLKSSCYITGWCLRMHKTLQCLMGTMEREGMFLRVSDVVRNPDHAFAIGKRLVI